MDKYALSMGVVFVAYSLKCYSLASTPSRKQSLAGFQTLLLTERSIYEIGDGIAKVSAHYRLARADRNDVRLVETPGLMSGSTSHAAGNLPHFSIS